MGNQKSANVLGTAALPEFVEVFTSTGNGAGRSKSWARAVSSPVQGDSSWQQRDPSSESLYGVNPDKPGADNPSKKESCNIASDLFFLTQKHITFAVLRIIESMH